MSQRELNLGIVAHVDAGKTTLTERLLYEAGVIDEIGSVDAGTTQTDTLDLERQRGITIKSAVTSFALGDVHVNLIDTPGPPGLHRGGRARAERPRRRGARDLRGRGRPAADAHPDACAPAAADTDAAVREQDRPRRSRRGPRAPGHLGTPRGRGRPDVGAGRAGHARRVRQAPRRRLGAPRAARGERRGAPGIVRRRRVETSRRAACSWSSRPRRGASSCIRCSSARR